MDLMVGIKDIMLRINDMMVGIKDMMKRIQGFILGIKDKMVRKGSETDKKIYFHGSESDLIIIFLGLQLLTGSNFRLLII